MKTFTKSVLTLAVVAAFVSFTSCGNANTTNGEAVEETTVIEETTAPEDTTAVETTEEGEDAAEEATEEVAD